MYSRFLQSLCKRSSYYAWNGITFQANRLCQVASKKEEKRNIEPTMYPGFKIIYTFPYIKHASALNAVKRRFTTFIGVSLPAIIGLYLTNVLSFDITITTITSGIVLTLWLHSCGILCNNLVGYIYLNLSEQRLVLSYIDYWGRRVNLKTTVDKVIPLSDNPSSITDPLYKRIFLLSQKENLKINLKLGMIVDPENFKYILGMV